MINDWAAAGLPRPSKAKGYVQTIERRAIMGSYGVLSAADLANVQATVHSILYPKAEPQAVISR